MIRLLLFALLIYLLYHIVLKPILSGYRNSPKGNKDGNPTGRIDQTSDDYIEYEEIK